jgi:hypothetical protein
MSRRIYGDNDPGTLTGINNLGGLLVQLGRHREAVELVSAAEAPARRVFVGGHADRLATCLAVLGKAIAGSAQPPEFTLAEGKLVEAHTIFDRLRGPAHKDTRDCVQALVALYEAWHAAEPGGGHEKQAAEWKAKLAAEPAKEAPR